jgi:hypothetical protein
MFQARLAVPSSCARPAIPSRSCRTCAQSCGRSALTFRWSTSRRKQQIDQLLFQERLVARLSSLFGLAALLLAAIGLYGLLAHEVTRGTREIGIRVALGAPAGQVLRRVVRHGVALAAVGVAHRHRGVIRGDTPTGQHALRCEARRSRNARSGEYSAYAGRTGRLLHSGAPRYPGRPAGGPTSRVSQCSVSEIPESIQTPVWGGQSWPQPPFQAAGPARERVRGLNSPPHSVHIIVDLRDALH